MVMVMMVQMVRLRHSIFVERFTWLYFEISMIAFQSKKLCQRIISIWCRHQEQHSFEMIIASSNLFGIKNNIPYHLQICLQGPGFVQICVACRNTKQLKRFETMDKGVSVRPLQCVWPLHWSTSQDIRRWDSIGKPSTISPGTECIQNRIRQARLN